MSEKIITLIILLTAAPASNRSSASATEPPGPAVPAYGRGTSTVAMETEPGEEGQPVARAAEQLADESC